MRDGRLMIGMAGVTACCAALLLATSAAAQVPYPERAIRYSVDFVRAMDECMGAGVTIVNPGSIAGCPQTNVDTDTGITSFRNIIMRVSRNTKRGVYMRLSGYKMTPPGAEVGLMLTVRTTNTLGLPAGTSKTYEDQTVICGETSGGACGNFTTVASNGRLMMRQTLDECLAANGLSSFIGQGNIAIKEAVLINCDTGKVFAEPGVLQDN